MAPSLLLDTHALLWWLVVPEMLSSLALAAINDSASSIFVSAASGWELATKVRLGKLPGAERLLEDLPSLLQHQGYQPLAVQLHHGVHAGASGRPTGILTAGRKTASSIGCWRLRQSWRTCNW